MKSNYDILGNHIRLIDTRNRESITDRVLGINIDKFFMPSVANVIGTDLSKYKLITKGKFACNPMHVGRDERLPVALYDEEEPAIVSPAYFSFCLDEEDINPLQNFVAQIKSADSDSVIYVSTYGYEITNSKGEKSTYADALWIDTVLPISQIERYIEKSGVAEPSNISFVGDSDECGNYKVWIIAQEENNPHIIELTDRKKIDHMIILYWD